MKFRFFNMILAHLGGYFWLPCPFCGKHFGGHEWKDIDGKCSSIPTNGYGSGKGICPDCTVAGRGYYDFSGIQS